MLGLSSRLDATHARRAPRRRQRLLLRARTTRPARLGGRPCATQGHASARPARSVGNRWQQPTCGTPASARARPGDAIRQPHHCSHERLALWWPEIADELSSGCVAEGPDRHRPSSHEGGGRRAGRSTADQSRMLRMRSHTDRTVPARRSGTALQPAKRDLNRRYPQGRPVSHDLDLKVVGVRLGGIERERRGHRRFVTSVHEPVCFEHARERARPHRWRQVPRTGKRSR